MAISNRTKTLVAIGFLAVAVLPLVLAAALIPSILSFLPGMGPECVPSAPTPGSKAITGDTVSPSLEVLGVLCDPDERGLVQDLLWQDGGWLVTARGREAVWWSADGQDERRMGIYGALSLREMPDNSILAGLEGGDVSIWKDGEQVREIADHSSDVWWTEARPTDPNEIVSIGRGIPDFNGDLRWTDHRPLERKLDGNGWCGAWSADGSQLAVCEGGTVTLYSDDGANQSKRETGVTWIYQVEWPPQGTDRLAVCGDGVGVVVFDKDGTELNRRGVDGTPRTLAWSPDGSVFAVGTWGGSLWIFDRDGTALYRKDLDKGRIQALAWSEDGTLIATGGEGGLVHVWGLR